MKKIFILILIPMFFSCRQQADNTQILKDRIDRLENQLKESYKPGFGESMGSIQTHHAKLWFAGENKNWKLASFEVHELIEGIDNVKKYQAERKESQYLGMLDATLDSVNKAVEQKDAKLFKNAYTNLTKACNECHQITDFEFNIVKIPDRQEFSNQNFKVN